MKTILVTGGAGYIGSHVCKYLASKGYLPVVLDDLSCGHRQAVKWGPFEIGSTTYTETEYLREKLCKYNFCAVMHFAGSCYVGESISNPKLYYENNVVGTINLLHIMRGLNINKFIFSSSCAVYGNPIDLPITEDSFKIPVSPYGRTKLIVESILQDYGIDHISLRYFNAAGADPEGDIGEDHRPETHLIPILLKSILDPQIMPEIYGIDYPTHDGTCIRDYVHVEDIARAHVLALEYLLSGNKSDCFNIGIGKGFTVQEVMDSVERITGSKLRYRFAPRRLGDAVELYSSCEKIKNILGWQPKFRTLDEIISTAWSWHKLHPTGMNP
jgi:UDP-glucose 4-epimerase